MKPRNGFARKNRSGKTNHATVASASKLESLRCRDDSRQCLTATIAKFTDCASVESSRVANGCTALHSCAGIWLKKTSRASEKRSYESEWHRNKPPPQKPQSRGCWENATSHDAEADERAPRRNQAPVECDRKSLDTEKATRCA